MRLTILGATGRIGRHAVAQAVSAGHDVAVLVRDSGRLGDLRDRVRVVTGTVGEPGAVDEAVVGAEAVISAGRYVAGPHALRPGARISRADVAHLMLAEAESPTHVGHPGIFVRSA